MGNNSDGCCVNISTATAATEPSASKSRERSRNDLKLAKHISNTFQNFNECSNQPVSTVIDKNNSIIEQKLTSSNEPVVKNAENPSREDFHANTMETTRKSHKNLLQNEKY